MATSRQIRRRNRKINNTLVVILLLAMLLTIPAFLFNMTRVRNVDTGEGTTIEETPAPVENDLLNDYYSIGYNATEINKEYFRALDEAVEAETIDREKVAGHLVKCFVTEYYTWTNKDGNYDIGGMQYIFTDKRTDFENYTRYNFYADLDLYLTQYSRDALIQVKDVTVNSVSQTDGFTPEGSESVYECWSVDASWTYEDSSAIDIYSIQNHAVFLVADHDGRMEIVAIDREEVTADDQTEWTEWGY